MITCPWCGTNYHVFQSNCKNCGGTLPAGGEDRPAPSTQYEAVAMPPPAPRPITERYTWRLMLTDGWAVSALVLAFLGVTFALTGAGLTLGIVTAFVGVPFLLMGIAFSGLAAAGLFWRYEQARKVVTVLRSGEATTGRIIDVQENYSVRINGRHPWVIRYQFQAQGQEVEGRVSTLNPVGQGLQAGGKVCILYLPTTPQWNSIYPHP